MGGTVVGIDIGSTSLRAVEVQAYDGAKPSIVRFAEMALPENAVRRGEVVETSTVTTALRRLWASGGFKTKDVVLGVGGARVFARDFTVPKAPLEQVRESLPFLVQDLLPVPVSDAILDFYPVAEEDGENGRVLSGLLVAGLTDAITANVTAVLAAGLHPLHVDLIPFAITRAITPYRRAQGRDALISIGASTINIVVVEDSIPQFVRMIPNGSDDITRALVTRLQWAPEQAEQAKRAVGMGGPMTRPEDRPVLEVVYEVVGELLSSIRNTLSYYASSRPAAPVQRVLLSGGGARLAGLPHALGEMVGMPVTLADPLAEVPLPARKRSGSSRPDLAAFTTAFGLALGSHA